MKLPRLSLRDLFWLVALIAMGCGWWVHGMRLDERLREALLWKARCESLQYAIEKAEISVEWHDDWVGIEGRNGTAGFGVGVSIDEP